MSAALWRPWLAGRILARSGWRGVASQAASPVKTHPSRTKLKMEKEQNTPLDQSILQRLDRTDAGYLTTSIRRKLNQRGREIQKDESPLPAPFDSAGRQVKQIHEWTPESLETVLQLSQYSPQVALIGRSNVGKSSLLNAVMGFNSTYVQKAHASDKPGDTRDLVFYGIGRARLEKEEMEKLRKQQASEGLNPKEKARNHPPALMIVDMPGYGFSYMTEENKQRCREITVGYLLGTQLLQPRQLKRVLLLVDARHGLKKADADFLTDLAEAVTAFREKNSTNLELPKKLSWKLQVVFTKCDLVERNLLCRRMTIFQDELAKLLPAWLYNDRLPMIAVSSFFRKGIPALQRDLAALVPHIPPPPKGPDRSVLITTVDKFVGQTANASAAPKSIPEAPRTAARSTRPKETQPRSAQAARSRTEKSSPRTAQKSSPKRSSAKSSTSFSGRTKRHA